MVPYCDVAIVKFVANLFKDDPSGITPVVYWGPPEASRQSLAIGEKHSSVGVPGVSIFRTGIAPDGQRYNQPAAAQYGHPVVRSSDNKTENRFLTIPVVAEYTAVGWSRALSDVNAIEREMWFSTRYKVLDSNIPTDEPDNYRRWFISVSPPTYQQNIQESSGQIIWYSVSQRYLVYSEWIHTTNLPLVNEIIINIYDQVTSGEPIDQDLLNTITVVPST